MISPLLGSDVYFSPKGGIRGQIIKRINASKISIDVAVYSFTAGDIAEALVNAAKRGVKIRVIRDAIQSSNKNDENAFLEKNGIQVEIRTGRGRGIMHDKFAIFDGKEIFTGSYNWTNNAEQNNWENAYFTAEMSIVQSFKQEYEKLWIAHPPPPRRSHNPHSKSRYSHNPRRVEF